MGKDFIKKSGIVSSLWWYNLFKFFLLGRDAHQGHTISSDLSIMALETLFRFIRSKPEIKGLAIFNHCYL